MRKAFPALCAAASGVLLSGCSGLHHISDPQTFTMPKEAVPGFLKSVRCEMVTYLEAARAREANYKARSQTDLNRTLETARYFVVDEAQWGALFLDLKVTNTAGITSAAFDNRLSNYLNHAETLRVGPTLSAEGVYSLNWSFAFKQSATLNVSTAENPHRCYSNVPADKERLAYGHYGELEQFQRISVSGGLPLAGWLLENGNQVGTTWLGREQADADEALWPGQLGFSFTIQATAGFDVKYMLTTTTWNPLMPQVGASSKQASNLLIYVNGPNAKVALGAKTGTALISPSGPKPIPVYFERPAPSKKAGTKTRPPTREFMFLEGTLPPSAPRSAPRVAPQPRSAPVPVTPRGTLEYPPLIVPTVPGSQ